MFSCFFFFVFSQAYHTVFVDVERTKSVRVMNKALKIAYLKYISVLISLFRLHGPFEASLYAESDSWSEVGRRRKGEKAYVGLLCYK